MRRVLHVDMDAFFAAVEVLRRPELGGRPLIIGGSGDPAKRGVVSTASYEARRFGVHSGMPLRTAHGLCPECVFLPVDYAEYRRVSGLVKKVLREASAIMEDVGIDEAFIDISDAPETSEHIARRIKDAIKRRTGLTCSIGIAPNKLVAKMASDLEKPDGLTIVLPDEVQTVLDPLPVRKLRGVGPRTEARLRGLGILTVRELREAPAEALVERFGPSHGRYLYEASRGVDERPLVTYGERKSVSREETFQTDLSSWQDIACNLAAIARQVAEDLQRLGLAGRTVTVKLRYSDFTTLTRATTLPEPTGREDEIRRAAFLCLGRFDLEGRLIRLLGIRMSSLCPKVRGGSLRPLPSEDHPAKQDARRTANKQRAQQQEHTGDSQPPGQERNSDHLRVLEHEDGESRK